MRCQARDHKTITKIPLRFLETKHQRMPIAGLSNALFVDYDELGRVILQIYGEIPN